MTLVTGGDGFIGSHLVDTVDGESADVKSGCDLRNFDEALDAVEGHDEVFHLAANIGGVGYLRDRPAKIISGNDLINKNVFDACVQCDVDRIVFAGSSMVYSEVVSFPVAESRIFFPPEGAYGFQKLNGEYYCKAYNRQYGLDYVVARIFNAVGPGDFPGDVVGHGHVVPDLVRKIVELRQDPVGVRGDGKQTRCFVDVDDVVRGMILMMKFDCASNEVFNLGSQREVSIKDLAKMIWDLASRSGEIDFSFGDPFEGDVGRRVPDVKKAKEKLGWESRISLEGVLRRYIEWYVVN